MPHHKSAKKRVRQTVKRTEMNKVRTTMAKTVLKKFKAAVDAGDKSQATELLTQSQSLLARLAKKGVIKDNTAARKTGRLARQVSKIS